MWGPTLMTVIIISLIDKIDMTDADDFELTYDVNGPIHADVGTPVTIGCSFIHHPGFTPRFFRWYKCDEAIFICSPSDLIFHSANVNAGQDEFKGRVSLLEPDVTQKNASIVIRDIRLADIGSYQLQIVGTMNGKQFTYKFHNKKPIKVTGLAQPMITGKTSVREGDTLTLTCQAESAPPSVITLTKAGSHVPLAAGTQRANLVIPRATWDHAGWYTCTAEHVFKRLSSFTIVTVFEKCQIPDPIPIPSPTPEKFFSNPLTNFTNIIFMALIGVLYLALIAGVWKTCHRRHEKTNQVTAMRVISDGPTVVEMVTQQTGESPPAVDGAEDTQPKALVGVGETSPDGDIPVPATPPI